MLDNIIIQLKLRTVWSWPREISWALDEKPFFDVVKSNLNNILPWVKFGVNFQVHLLFQPYILTNFKFWQSFQTLC